MISNGIDSLEVNCNFWKLAGGKYFPFFQIFN